MTGSAALPLLGFVPGSGDLILDFDGVLEFGLFVEGVSRSGKTNLVRVFLEQTYPLAQQLIFDPEGEYGTLRSEARPYLIVGRGGDVAIEPAVAPVQLLVRKLVEQRVSTVFDLSEYDDDEQRVIVAAACEELVRLPVGHAGEIIVVIEEVQDFAPESGSGRASALAAVRRLSKRGAKRGVRLVGSSQRVADVSKGVVTQLKNKAIGGTDQSDLVRALEELGLPREMRKDVADLPQGEFYVKGPAVSRHAVRVRVPKSETAPEKRRRGQGAAPRPPAPAMIAALASALADVPREAAEEQATVESLRRRVAELGVELQRARAATPAPVLDEAMVTGIARRARQDLLSQVRGAFTKPIELLSGAVDRLGASHRDLQTAALALDGGLDALLEHAENGNGNGHAPPAVAASAVEGLGVRSPEKVQRPESLRPASSTASSDPRIVDLSRPQLRMIDALAELRRMGLSVVQRNNLAVFSEQSPTSSGYEKNLSTLRTRGLIEYPSTGTVTLTDAGAAAAKAMGSKPRFASRADLQDAWRRFLSGPQVRMLDVLVKIYPRAIAKDALAAQTGQSQTSSGFEKNLSTMRSLGLVSYPSPGHAAATTLLFPEGGK
jgi:hypothetical protein